MSNFLGQNDSKFKEHFGLKCATQGQLIAGPACAASEAALGRRGREMARIGSPWWWSHLQWYLSTLRDLEPKWVKIDQFWSKWSILGHFDLVFRAAGQGHFWSKKGTVRPVSESKIAKNAHFRKMGILVFFGSETGRTVPFLVKIWFRNGPKISYFWDFLKIRKIGKIGEITDFDGPVP